MHGDGVKAGKKEKETARMKQGKICCRRSQSLRVGSKKKRGSEGWMGWQMALVKKLGEPKMRTNRGIRH